VTKVVVRGVVSVRLLSLHSYELTGNFYEYSLIPFCPKKNIVEDNKPQSRGGMILPLRGAVVFLKCIGKTY